MTTKILKCTCAHQFQNKRYGEGMRVHNICKFNIRPKGGGRCTVCGKVKELSGRENREEG